MNLIYGILCIRCMTVCLKKQRKNIARTCLIIKKFFEDALSMITNCLQNTLEEQKQIVKTDIWEKGG